MVVDQQRRSMTSCGIICITGLSGANYLPDINSQNCFGFAFEVCDRQTDRQRYRIRDFFSRGYRSFCGLEKNFPVLVSQRPLSHSCELCT